MTKLRHADELRQEIEDERVDPILDVIAVRIENHKFDRYVEVAVPAKELNRGEDSGYVAAFSRLRAAGYRITRGRWCQLTLQQYFGISW